MMRNMIAVVLLLGWVLASAAEAAESSSAASPAAVVPEWRFNFEPAVEGNTLTHDFVIQNKGRAPLNVLEVKTS